VKVRSWFGLRLWALFVVLALVAVACGDDDDDGGAAAEGVTETTGGGEEDGSSEVSADTSATFRFATSSTPSSMDPARSTIVYDRSMLNMVFDRLLRTNPDTADLEPGLATEWSFNDAGDELVFELRDDVLFHDGTPFDAEAVKANIDRMKTLEGSNFIGQLEVVESVEVVDEFTVLLRVKPEEAGVVPNLMAERPGMMMSPAAMTNTDLDVRPVGSGLWKLEGAYSPGATAVFSRFDDYWDDDALAVAPAKFEVLNLPDETARLNALSAGEVHSAQLSGRSIDQAKTSGFATEIRPTFSTYNLRFNRGKEPVEDERIRQAINFALDREALIEGLLFGYGEPVVQAFPKDHWAHADGVDDEYLQHDPERARELLAEAGYPDGIDLEMIQVAALAPFSEAVQAQLAEVGINLSLLTVEPQNYAVEFYRNDRGMFLIGPGGGRPDPILFFEGYHGSNGGSNACECAPPELDELIAEGKAPGTPEERAERVQEVSRYVTEHTLDVYMWSITMFIANSDEVIGELSTFEELFNTVGVGLES